MIETERLILRRVTMADVEDLVALNLDPATRRFIPNAAQFDHERATYRVENDEHEWNELGRRMLIARARDTGVFVGRLGIFDWPQFGETEVGWALAPEVRGHGYATEAARECQRWAFQHLTVPYLTALIRPDNEASIAVATRLGMTVLRSDMLFDTPVLVHAITRDKFEAARPALSGGEG
jgi:RimJ/RimL family protein N-acetyltransferase